MRDKLLLSQRNRNKWVCLRFHFQKNSAGFLQRGGKGNQGVPPSILFSGFTCQHDVICHALRCKYSCGK